MEASLAHRDAAAAAAPVEDGAIPVESVVPEVPTAEGEPADFEAADVNVRVVLDTVIDIVEHRARAVAMVDVQATDDDVRVVLDTMIDAVEYRAHEARDEIVSIMNDMLHSVSTMENGHPGVDVAVQGAASVAESSSAQIGEVPEAAAGAPDEAGGQPAIEEEQHDQGGTIDEDVPRDGGGGVDDAAADVVVSAESPEGAVADDVGGVGFDSSAATVEIGIGGEGGGQVTAFPVLTPAERAEAATPVVTAGDHEERSGGGWWWWWRWLLWGPLWVAGLVLVVNVFIAAFATFDSYMMPSPCNRRDIVPGSPPLKVGECIEWDGGTRGLSRLLPGVKAKSRLTVIDGGGIYVGPDGIEVPLGKVLDKTDSGSGLLCGAERLVRKVVGIGQPPYAAKTVRSRLVFGAGTFCRSHSTPPPPSIFGKLHHGRALFSDDGHLQVIGRGGNVLWSAVDDVVGVEESRDKSASECWRRQGGTPGSNREARGG